MKMFEWPIVVVGTTSQRIVWYKVEVVAIDYKVQLKPARSVVGRRNLIHYYACVKTADLVWVSATSFSDMVRTTESMASSSVLSHL